MLASITILLNIFRLHMQFVYYTTFVRNAVAKDQLFSVNVYETYQVWPKK